MNVNFKFHRERGGESKQRGDYVLSLEIDGYRVEMVFPICSGTSWVTGQISQSDVCLYQIENEVFWSNNSDLDPIRGLDEDVAGPIHMDTIKKYLLENLRVEAREIIRWSEDEEEDYQDYRESQINPEALLNAAKAIAVALEREAA